MLYILAFAFFLICMLVDRSKQTAAGRAGEAAPNVERTTGKLVFGEHWQAWADAISREAEETWEEQAA